MKTNVQKVLEKHLLWTRGEECGVRADLSGAILIGANLSGADLSGADLSGANLIGANLSRADLSGANLIGVNLSGAILIGANLSRANLIGAKLIGAKLIGADLSDAILSWARLSDAYLRDADLSDAYLRDADLRDAYLRGAKLAGCVGDMKFIKSIQLDTYPIAYTSSVLQIGCNRYSFDEWRSFSDQEIIEMDGKKALQFWRKWKDTIFQLIEMSPAEGDCK